jgi:hypothetical protein
MEILASESGAANVGPQVVTGTVSASLTSEVHFPQAHNLLGVVPFRGHGHCHGYRLFILATHPEENSTTNPNPLLHSIPVQTQRRALVSEARSPSNGSQNLLSPMTPANPIRQIGRSREASSTGCHQCAPLSRLHSSWVIDC